MICPAVHYEYFCHTHKAYTEYLVAGGGLDNGNAYATIEEHADKIVYREYGREPVYEVWGDHHLVHDDEGFTVRENDPPTPPG